MVADGLQETVNSLYPWLLEAEITNATIGRDLDGNLVWYKGIWQCGRWFGGTWISGAWLSGDYEEVFGQEARRLPAESD